MIENENWSSSLRTYFDELGSKEGLAARLGILTRWADMRGVSRRQLMNTEFGVSHHTFQGSGGASVESAARFVRDVREISEAAGIGCITMHEMQGSQFAVASSEAPLRFDSPLIAQSVFV